MNENKWDKIKAAIKDATEQVKQSKFMPNERSPDNPVFFFKEQ